MKKIFIFQLFLGISINIFAQKGDEPSGKISGVIFGDYYYNALRDTGFEKIKNAAVIGRKDVHGLQIRRINFTYDYKFSSKFSSRFRLESDEANFTASGSDKANKFGVYIKDAYIKWNAFKSHELYIGVQPTPAFEVSEGVWGGRYLEKTILDLRGYVASRDLAISIRGRIDTTGIVRYWFMYGNNSPGKPESDKYKRFYGNLEINPFKDLSITAYADYQTKDDIKNTYDGRLKNNNVLTAAFFVGYKVKNAYSFGVESIYNKIYNGYDNKTTSSLLDKTGMGLSVFGSLNFTPKTAIFGRYDYFEPNNNSDAGGDRRNWYIFGCTYKPVEKMIVSPNIIMETYEKAGALEIKSSVTPRITFSWTF